MFFLAVRSCGVTGVVCRVAAWGALVAVARCSRNTAEEIRVGREAWQRWQREGDLDGAQQPYTRVFGGFRTYVGLYPYAAFFLVLKNATTLGCSATIVAPKWSLTAGHCVRGMFWQGILFAGDVDYTTDRLFTKFNIQIRIVRESFDYTPPQPDQLKHDIAVLELWREFIIEQDYVTTIPLTDRKTLGPDFKETCAVVGFGLRGKDVKPSRGIQRGASFLMEPGPRCGRPEIQDNGMCTLDVAKKSCCQGDSGGPVFCSSQRVLMAIIAGGRYENCSMQWCGAPVLHNYHMFVGYYREWILRLIQRTRSSGGQRDSSGSGSSSTALLPALVPSMLCCAINTYPHF